MDKQYNFWGHFRLMSRILSVVVVPACVALWATWLGHIAGLFSWLDAKQIAEIPPAGVMYAVMAILWYYAGRA